jgi:DNA-directed RNA polymerase specialized sigma24 family protein
MRDEPAWPWILGIARNLARNHLRKRNQGQAIPLEAIEELVVSDFDAAFADVISRDSVQTMMAELTPAQRQVVGLRHVLGLRFIEIANLTGRTSPAVRKLHQRAIEVLKPGLETTPTEQGRTRSTRTPVRILMRKSPTLRTRRFALARELGTRMLPR